MNEPMFATDRLNDWFKEDLRQPNIFRLMLIISLFGTFTNYAHISTLASIFALMLWPFGLTLGWRVPKPTIALAFLFGLVLIHVVIYGPELLFDRAFYRRDGNFFVTMTPLLFFTCLAFPLNLKLIVERFVYFVTVLNLIVFLVWLIMGVALFRDWAPDVGLQDTTKLYHFLFVAHNAAGGFLGILCCLSMVMFLHHRNAINLAILALNIATLLATFSRGSIAGFFVAVLLVYLFRFSRKLSISVILGMLAINLILVGYIYNNTDILPILARQVLVTQIIGDLHPSVQPLLDGNTAIRLETLWPMAMHAFFQSPIFGIGFSAFNDVPWDLWGWEGLVAFNLSQTTVSSDATAHNTYLQLLAETGILGLALLLWFVKRLFDYLIESEPGMVRDGLLMSLWMALVSAFSEHRFFTPSQMLPFVLILAMHMANTNYKILVSSHLQDLSKRRRNKLAANRR